MQGTSREADLLIMVILFTALALFVTTKSVLKIDLVIEDAVFNTHSTIGVFICKALSFIGKWYVYVGVSCVLFLVPKTRFSVGLPVGFTLGIAMGMNKILKALLMIQRPAAFRLTKVTRYSFPSGHKMYGTAFKAQ